MALRGILSVVGVAPKSPEGLKIIETDHLCENQSDSGSNSVQGAWLDSRTTQSGFVQYAASESKSLQAMSRQCRLAMLREGAMA